jgi:hypothetical protein
MRAYFDAVGVGVGILIFVIVFVALSWGGYLAYLRFVEGPAINQHTLNVRHSIGYIDAQNAHSRNDIGEYTGATDPAHQCALLKDIRATEGQLQPDEVSSDVAQFMALHASDCP